MPVQRQGKARELADRGLCIYDAGFCIQAPHKAKNASFKEAEKSGSNERDGGFLSAFTGIGGTIFSKD